MVSFAGIRERVGYRFGKPFDERFGLCVGTRIGAPMGVHDLMRNAVIFKVPMRNLVDAWQLPVRLIEPGRDYMTYLLLMGIDKPINVVSLCKAVHFSYPSVSVRFPRQSAPFRLRLTSTER